MTDPGTADRTYIGPMSAELVEEILEKERPDAVLPTMGGQTSLNLAKALSETGILDKYGVELIGAKLPSINKAEDRELFKQAMVKIGLKTPPSGTISNWSEALEVLDMIGKFPLIIRPAFTLGGTGGGIAYNMDEYQEIINAGLNASVTNQVLVEQSLLGWKEYELEVMRDMKDNVVIICSIENVDPMGVHTGDSITIAPAQTLTDKEYQRLRDAAVAIIREMGVETGGSNVQMGIDPEDGEMMIIEMNPRVSRSSALASKATGFPIAKIAAKLAVGLTLDQIPNDITLKTPASFEPSIDYIVTKIPRFAFEKFPGSKAELSTQMKSVGEAMAMGRTFQESFQKALRSLETGLDGFSLPKNWKRMTDQQLIYGLRVPNPDRMMVMKQAMVDGMSQETIFEYTKIDPWFLSQLGELHEAEQWLKTQSLDSISYDDLLATKQRGFSDVQIARCMGVKQDAVRSRRQELKVEPSFKRVDTCAAEFEAATPYMYSSYDGECESMPTDKPKVLILGGGPNRIGQGIEFDYCCCHASFALRADGYETIMMNSNPETVSTDYDTSSRLYFEPLTIEDVLNVIEKERPEGIIIQFGGQTPLKLANAIQKALEDNPLPAASGKGNVRIWGTQPKSIDDAEDRDKWYEILTKLDIKQPPGGMCTDESSALNQSKKLGFPVMVRPSFVLGGRAMEIVYSETDLKRYIENAVEVDPERPVLVDKYMDRADELDVDALCDKDGNVFIIEANPRASRTVPFVAKAIGHPIAKYASLLMSGKTLAELKFTEEPKLNHVAVKEAVLPFDKFPGADTLLGPEMRSTGEVMGIDSDFSKAYAKAALAAGQKLPASGNVFVSMTDKYKEAIVPIAKELKELGYSILSTGGTGKHLKANNVDCEVVLKIQEGRPNIGDLVKNGDIAMMLITSTGKEVDVIDGKNLRRLALAYKVPIITTVAGAKATTSALAGMKKGPLHQVPLQDYFPEAAERSTVEFKIVG
ncbi:MAG: carbamoyl-phosphate synthase large chain-like [Trebouxia sp. A1-2]|nr:MAG: carbamoyl-phosphate synthase large chain-like [Trebouxia sp. A1-2]